MTLDETLKLLRANEVRAAKFHADGSIAEIEFAPSTPAFIEETEALATERPDPALTSYENALDILQRGRDQRNGADS